MNDYPITLRVPFAGDAITLGFTSEADADVRLLLRFARARVHANTTGFWLEYLGPEGHTVGEMVWIGLGAMPNATFDTIVAQPVDDDRQDAMAEKLAYTHHLVFTDTGWDPAAGGDGAEF